MVAPIPKSQLPKLPMGEAIWVSKKLVTCSRAHVYQEVRGELSTGLLLHKLFVEHPKGTSSMHGDTSLILYSCAQDRTKEAPSQSPVVPALREREARRSRGVRGQT